MFRYPTWLFELGVDITEKYKIRTWSKTVAEL